MKNIFAPKNVALFRDLVYQNPKLVESMNQAIEVMVEEGDAKDDLEAEDTIIHSLYVCNAMISSRYGRTVRVSPTLLTSMAIVYTTYRRAHLVKLMDNAPKDAKPLFESVIILPPPPEYIARSMKTIFTDLSENIGLVMYSPDIAMHLLEAAFCVWSSINDYIVDIDGILDIDTKRALNDLESPKVNYEIVPQK